MLAVKAGISVLEKIAPKAVAALGKAGVVELALLAGGVAEGLNLAITPLVDKGGKFVKDKFQTAAANKRQELLEKKAALLAQKAQEAQAEVAAEAEAQTEEVPVEEKPKTSGKKNKK